MKQRELKYEVLARYLAGEENSEDEKEISEWLDADASNRRKLKEFEYIWTSAAGKTGLKQKWTEIDNDWQELKEQIDQQNTDSAETPSSLKILPSRHSNGKLKQFLQVAAAVLIVGLAGFFAYKFSPKKSQKKEAPAMRVFTTEKGEHLNLTLSDGTQVILNADSKLKLPEKLASNKRQVYLQGEAYFKVTHNSGRPFLVHSAGTTTRDLGTAFVIRAYSDDSQVLLVVAEGRVKFEPDTEDSQKYSIVTGNQLIKYDVEEEEVTKKKVKDLDLYLGWTEGHLNFKNEPMSKVARRLEHHYDVNVIFKDKDIETKKLTASLNSKKITNVLNVIAKALDIHYRIENNEVIFTNN